jgi:hypothetical protein
MEIHFDFSTLLEHPVQLSGAKDTADIMEATGILLQHILEPAAKQISDRFTNAAGERKAQSLKFNISKGSGFTLEVKFVIMLPNDQGLSGTQSLSVVNIRKHKEEHLLDKYLQHVYSSCLHCLLT